MDALMDKLASSHVYGAWLGITAVWVLTWIERHWLWKV